ncbi:CDP-diacylglycerol--glycerol-3-phosphate 3-phosphatidyltransferase [Rhodovibrionaceae bacterium A322]
MLTNLPNLLTLARIGAIPLVVALLYSADPWARWSALAVYTLACITDYYDGKLARDRGLVSPLGRFLDPIADKLLVTSILMLLIASGDIAGLTVLAALVILFREILVSGLREYLAEISVSMPVSKLAKWKTGAQMVSLGLFIMAPVIPQILLPGEILLWSAAILTAITGWDYLSHGLKHMIGD